MYNSGKAAGGAELFMQEYGQDALLIHVQLLALLFPSVRLLAKTAKAYERQEDLLQNC